MVAMLTNGKKKKSEGGNESVTRCKWNIPVSHTYMFLLIPPQRLLGTACWVAAELEHALNHAENTLSSVSNILRKLKISRSEFLVTESSVLDLTSRLLNPELPRVSASIFKL